MAAELEMFGGTDGFRGNHVNSAEPKKVNAVTFERLAFAYTNLTAERTNTRPTVIVGGDTRTSSPELIDAVSRGAAATGADVWNVGIAPTSTIAWLAQENGASAIAITASHNPNSYNGFKPFDPGGVKPNKETLEAIEDLYGGHLNNAVLPDKGGSVTARPELLDTYLDALVTKLGGNNVLSDKLIVVDGAYGAVSDLAPRLYRGLGAEVIEFACDGQDFINNGCGAAHLEGVQTFLANHPKITNDPRFIGAFSNDGDGDRVMGIDSHGRIVNGNHWMRLLAEGQKGIVGTLYTNSALREAVEEAGVEFHECDNGDSHVTAKLIELTKERGEGFRRGGEFTGHLINLDHLTSGDGLYMGSFMATYLAKHGATLDDISESLKLWPERMSNIPTNGANAKLLVTNPVIQNALQELTQSNNGASTRVVLRASGTEPLIRVWAEAQDPRLVDSVVKKLSSTVESLVPKP